MWLRVTDAGREYTRYAAVTAEAQKGPYDVYKASNESPVASESAAPGNIYGNYRGTREQTELKKPEKESTSGGAAMQQKAPEGEPQPGQLQEYGARLRAKKGQFSKAVMLTIGKEELGRRTD